ncbi:MAG TPA: hypothetical protein VGW78_01065 [Candidatus Babeliales bacterium]|jgi:hypothetical protein|nr:hypothetical protein [Candidatus Babeliales bacterium]
MNRKYMISCLVLCTVFAYTIYPNSDPNKQLWHIQDPETIIKGSDLSNVDLKNPIAWIVSLLYKKQHSLYLPQAFIMRKSSYGLPLEPIQKLTK